MPDDRTIHVLYPRGARSGGPEVLHQLVDALRGSGVEAGLVPVPSTADADRVAEYERYDAPEFPWPTDTVTNTIVGPEIYLRELATFRAAEVFCWWLSIDNCPLFGWERLRAGRRLGIPESRRASDLLVVRNRLLHPLSLWRRRLARMSHLAQSHYAQVYLRERLGISVAPLTDYTTGPRPRPRASDGGGVTDGGLAAQRPRVAYNVAKGGSLVADLRSSSRLDVIWDPLTGLTGQQVAEHLDRADVYLDLGHQPGKDRLPREAASHGAVAIVAMRGAGEYVEDVPIPAAHRVAAGPDIVRDAECAVRHVIADLPAARALQSGYREFVLTEKERFLQEVRDVFVIPTDGVRRDGVAGPR